MDKPFKIRLEPIEADDDAQDSHRKIAMDSKSKLVDEKTEKHSSKPRMFKIPQKVEK